jgi:acyl-CoA synthetase (AMP-forming)/AMP-acid ligase II
MRTLLTMLSAQADAHPRREAFVFHPETGAPASRTFGALATRARAIARRLRARSPGARRALLLFPSGLEYVDAIFACAAAGVVAIPAYPPDPLRLARSLPRLVAMLDDCRPDLVLTTEAFGQLIAMMPEARPLAAYEVVATDAVPDAEAEGWTEPDAGEDAPAIVQYTSGSTRSPAASCSATARSSPTSRPSRTTSASSPTR